MTSLEILVQTSFLCVLCSPARLKLNFVSFTRGVQTLRLGFVLLTQLCTIRGG
jgi:hypothetical protein